MESKSIFISSCSRRQLARRRPPARASLIRLQAILMTLVLVIGFGAFFAAHGGV